MTDDAAPPGADGAAGDDDGLLQIADLYHYTAVDGLHGILEDKQLWATHARYLNDTQEFTYGLDIILDELTRILDEVRRVNANAGPSRPSSGPGEVSYDDLKTWFLEGVLSVLDPNFEDDEPDIAAKMRNGAERTATLALLEDMVTPFVACMSTERDQLSQWRGYARGGYCVRFDSGTLQSSMRQVDSAGVAVPGARRPYLMNVLYVAEDFRDKIRGAIMTILREYRDVKDSATEARDEFLGEMFLQGSRLKNRKFFEEAEYRIIVRGRETFRTPSRLGLTPRTAISFDPSAINEVIVGPSEFAAVRAASIRRYFDTTGEHKPEVSISEIPYRDL